MFHGTAGRFLLDEYLLNDRALVHLCYLYITSSIFCLFNHPVNQKPTVKITIDRLGVTRFSMCLHATSHQMYANEINVKVLKKINNFSRRKETRCVL